MDRRTFLAATGLGVGVVAGCLSAGGGSETSSLTEADDENYAVETVVEGLDSPWGLAPLDRSRLLVTERIGSLKLVDTGDGTVTELDGTPTVAASGQGGLLDVTTHPEYPDPAWVYFTYAATDGNGGSATHLGRGRLALESQQVTDFEVLHVATPFVDSDGHFGSRVVFGDDGLVYVTVGDRQFKNFGPDHVAQDRSNELGTTLRLTPAGAIPADNPFTDDPGSADAVFSYGHRNAQGMAVHPETGAIWQAEFGERDGDELNIVERGGNYGWPVADEGCKYGTDEPIGVSHEARDDVVAPVYSWDCGSGGFPPSGTTFYTGDVFPEWQGDLLVSGLASQYLARFVVDGRDVTEAAPLLADRGARIRDVVTDPRSGGILVAVDGSNAPLVRLVPA